MEIPGYDNLTLIGRGGFAPVYRARQEGRDPHEPLLRHGSVQGDTVVSMADQQVVAAPWRSGAADPAAAAAVLADSCRGL